MTEISAVYSVIYFCGVKNEEKLREVLKFANSCGAICTTQKGAIPALPTPSMAQELVATAN